MVAPLFSFSVVAPLFSFSVVALLFSFSVVALLFSFSVVALLFSFSVVAPLFSFSVVALLFSFSVVAPLFSFSVVAPLFSFSVVAPPFSFSVVAPLFSFSVVAPPFPFSVVASDVLLAASLLTVTTQTAFLLPSTVVAVISTVPSSTAFTFPFWSTVATSSSEDVNTTTFAALFGVTDVVNLIGSPGFKVTLVLSNATVSTDFFATYKVITCFAPFTRPFFPLMVILVVPTFFPVKTPAFDTVATFFRLEESFR